MDKYGYSKVYDIDFLSDLPTKEHYSNLIKWIVKLTNCKTYLEVGVENGLCIHNIRNEVDVCEAVDYEDKMDDKDGIIFNNMTSDEFFSKNKKTYDIIFIDGDHRFPQVLKDFENSLKILNEFGIIIFHDSDPIDNRLTQDFYCSNSYKIVDHIHLNYPQLNIMTFPIHETGITFVMRRNDRRVKKFI